MSNLIISAQLRLAIFVPAFILLLRFVGFEKFDRRNSPARVFFCSAIVSSSFEGGPTYVTLIWDAMRISVNGAPGCVWPTDDVDLFLGRDLGLVKVKGAASRDEMGNVVMTMSIPEMTQLAKFSDPKHVRSERDDLA